MIFRLNVSDEERGYLLKNALALLYTPENEHFGIVPLEAQYMKTPVLASNSGGPKETVVDNETGFLLGKKTEDWASKMKSLVEDGDLKRTMGKKGKENVLNKFSFKAFSNFTDDYVMRTIGIKRKTQ